jgi:hypothetical protein
VPQIVLDGTGVTKASLIEGAYEYCGLNGYEFERTPEEMGTGLRHLNAMMGAWKSLKGIDLGFDFPTYGSGLLEEPSGVPSGTEEVIHAMLAQRLAPGLGATLSDEAKAVLSASFNDLLAAYAATPPSMAPARRMPSSGVRHSRFTLLP